MKKEKIYSKLFLILIFLILLTPSTISQTNQLKVTSEHPFYINNQWTPASQLQPGDILTLANGKKARITKITDVYPEQPITVYNLNVGYPNTFFANNVLVHNKPSSTLNSKGERIPLPQENEIPHLDEFKAEEWIDDTRFDGTIPPDLKQPVIEIKRKIIENVEHLSTEEFLLNLEKSVKEFNEYIGDEPYVVLLMEEGGSEQWVYDLSLKWLNHEPEGFAYLRPGNGRDLGEVHRSLHPFFAKGIKKVVLFDDIAYTGTGITRESADHITLQLLDYIRNGGQLNELEFITVLSSSTDSAVGSFYGCECFFETNLAKTSGMMFYDREVRNLEEILNWDSLDLSLIEILEKEGFTRTQTLLYSDFKVADSLSFPSDVANLIYTPDQSHIPILHPNHNIYTPYKHTYTEYWDKWKCRGRKASVILPEF